MEEAQLRAVSSMRNAGLDTPPPAQREPFETLLLKPLANYYNHGARISVVRHSEMQQGLHPPSQLQHSPPQQTRPPPLSDIQQHYDDDDGEQPSPSSRPEDAREVLPPSYYERLEKLKPQRTPQPNAAAVAKPTPARPSPATPPSSGGGGLCCGRPSKPKPSRRWRHLGYRLLGLPVPRRPPALEEVAEATLPSDQPAATSLPLPPPPLPPLDEFEPERRRDPEAIWALLERRHGDPSGAGSGLAPGAGADAPVTAPLHEVRLLRASWLLGPARAARRAVCSGRDLVPSRQMLEAKHPEAYISVEELRRLHTRGGRERRERHGRQRRGRAADVATAAATAAGGAGVAGAAAAGRPDSSTGLSAVGSVRDDYLVEGGDDDDDEQLPIVAVAMDWEMSDHPDPDGETLDLLAALLSQRRRPPPERAAAVAAAAAAAAARSGGDAEAQRRAAAAAAASEADLGDVSLPREFGVFLPWCSLLQPDSRGVRTPCERQCLDGALASLDLWYVGLPCSPSLGFSPPHPPLAPPLLTLP